MSGWATIRDSVGKTINLGRQNKANSLPVTMASDQDAIAVSGTVAVSNLPGTQPVSAASLPLPTNAAQETGGVLATISTAIATIAGAITGGAMKAVLQAGANVIGAVTQSGTWTVQPGNTANTTAWKVDGSAVTQPVSGTVAANATLQAGENHAGFVSSELYRATDTVTRPNDSTAYAANDVVADSTSSPTVRTWANVARGSGGAGLIVAARLVVEADPATVLSPYLIVCSAAPTAANDNAALALSTTDAEAISCIIPLYKTLTTNATASTSGSAVYQSAPGLCGAYKLSSGTDLKGLIVLGGAWTPTAQAKFLSTLFTAPSS